MKFLPVSIYSGARMLGLYRNVFSIGNTCAGAFNHVFGRPTPFPLTVNLLITRRCHYSCRMCVSTHAPVCADSAQQDMDFPMIKRFIGNVRQHRPIVHVGGGEPFMRKDMPDILGVIKKAGLKCLLTTNGFLMDARIVAGIVEADVDIVIVSLYGPEKVHDEIVGVPGAFSTTIENLRLLVGRRKMTRVFVSMIALPECMPFLGSFVPYLRSLGVDAVKIEHLNFLAPDELCGQAPFIVDGFDLTPAMLVQPRGFREEFIQDLVRLNDGAYRFGLPVHTKPFLSSRQLRDWYLGVPQRNERCGFITHSVFIDSHGNVLPCQFLPQCVLGNIHKDSLRDIWRSGVYERLRSTIRKIRPTVCRRCCKN